MTGTVGQRIVVALAAAVALVAPVALAQTTGASGVGALLRTAAGASAGPTVLRADGSVDPTAYRRMASGLATAQGIAYRFGDAAPAPTSTPSTVWARSSRPFLGHGTSTDRTYQVGGPQDAALNDYSSDQGQVGYVPRAGSPTVGVDHIETLSMSENTFSSQPRLSWTYYGAGHPEPDALPTSAAGTCMKRLGAPAGRFVAQARAYAHGEATADSLMAFDNGVISAAGTNTAVGQVCTQLPAHLRPSAISVTNGNEFALVTAWNTATLRSELVVIALGGAQKAGDFWGFDWRQLYPGVRNYGRPTFAKVLGSVPLPVAAATGVSAVSDDSASAALLKPDGERALLGDLTLSNEANRRSFISGVNRSAIASAGYAVVTSREERKVVFVDLQPLFQEIEREYFGSRSTFDAVTSHIGSGATQWPMRFSARPGEQPVVVKTLRTASAPSAVAGMLSGARAPRAYVATADGVLHVFSVRGLATTGAAAPGSIRQVGSVRVGANPTGITYVKDRATGDSVHQSLDDTLIVTARGSRAVQWIRLKGNGGSVVRTLRDSRMIDPISAEDDNTHGTESYVVSVADYSGGQVLDYRYGPVVFRTNGGARYGMGPTGHSSFEFSGAYRPGGRPFSISVTNVT